MKYLIAFFILFQFSSQAQSISKNVEVLTKDQVYALFPDSVLKKLNITFPIFKAYQYTDVQGLHYCLLTESQDEVSVNNDVINKKIKAVTFQNINGSYVQQWEINDHINEDAMKGFPEQSIWFWTKYTQFEDYDNDGLMDPIVIYGTSGNNAYDDGRIKFIIYYKGKKIAIRHQNGVLDDERDTRVDKAFYSLPVKLQSAVKQKMNLMVEKNHAIFPYGWQKAMQNKKTFFSERGD